ncbi:MAG: neutral zinc metallopeptidase [Beijerinckiaceae bacterium]|nr:neutral zinc metallopeptidase [Beijerinckiaceae bacterium]
MRWQDFGRSANVEDRRGLGGMGRGGLGLGTVAILGILGWALGIDPRLLIGGAEMVSRMGQGSQTAAVRPGTPSDDMGQFVAAVLASNEAVWSEVLPQQKGIAYVKPVLVLYSGQTRSACGGAQAAMGPFYCPMDQKVYLDTAFFADMKRRIGGGGDFAYAYVISHEVGHHVENLLGILPKVQAAQQRAMSRGEANNLSVRVELMADCLAGVWAANQERRQKFLEPGDLEAAVNTAQAIGDDRLQKASQGYAVPDSFTHGSSAQRVQWLSAGLKSGKVNTCNTFAR